MCLLFLLLLVMLCVEICDYISVHVCASGHIHIYIHSTYIYIYIPRKVSTLNGILGVCLSGACM